MLSRRRRSVRRARWALVWGALCFAGIQVGTGAATELWLLGLRDPDFAAKLSRLQARRAEAPGKSLVLLLGSSRTLLGVQSGQLNTSLRDLPAMTFNFGLSAAGPLTQLVCLKRLLAEGVRPDLLFVEVLPLLLNQPGGIALEEEWLHGKRLTHAEARLLARYYTEPERVVRQWAKARACPWLVRNFDLRKLIERAVFGAGGNSNRLVDADGWLRMFESGVSARQRQRYTSLARDQYSTAVGAPRLSPGAVRALGDLLELCRREHIPVVLFLMPEGEEFRRLYDPAIRAGVDEFLAGLCRDRDVPLIDARTWIDRPACFWDGHHLLPEGARAFTERFGREAVRPLAEGLAGLRTAARVGGRRAAGTPWE